MLIGTNQTVLGILSPSISVDHQLVEYMSCIRQSFWDTAASYIEEYFDIRRLASIADNPALE